MTKIEHENIKQSNNNNSSINININNNGNSSSKLVINHENNNNNNNNNSIIKNTNSNFALRKTKVNRLTKNYRKSNSNMMYTTTNYFKFQIKTKCSHIDKIAQSDLRTKKHKSHSRYINNVDNISKAFTSTFTKILSSIYYKNKSPNIREKKCIKKNFSTICIDDYEKTIIKNLNKITRFKSRLRNKTNTDNRLAQNSKFPLSSKNHTSKNYSSPIPKNNLLREKNYGTYSSIVNNKK